MGALTESQRRNLLKPIQPGRVADDGKNHASLEGFDVIAHLSRLFGFEGWDKEVVYGLIFETGTDDQKPRWTVAYHAKVRLTLRNPSGELVAIHEDAAVGDAQNQPSRADAHHLALTSAVTLATKRAAKDLGDQFGLSLYDKGSTDPVVNQVAVYGSAAATPPAGQKSGATEGSGAGDGQDSGEEGSPPPSPELSFGHSTDPF